MQRSARLRTVSSGFCDLFLESKHRIYIIYNEEKVSHYDALKIINFGWEKGGTEFIFSTFFSSVERFAIHQVKPGIYFLYVDFMMNLSMKSGFACRQSSFFQNEEIFVQLD